jgi:PAS domain S-box-containing protein
MNILSFGAKSKKTGLKATSRKFHTHVKPTGFERKMKPDELIVSKTDLKGNITYANDTFYKMASLTEQESIGAPHSIIRHPDMPRCVFKFLWDRISTGTETFAYVLNYAANGDHYWVFAHVTPTYDADNILIGYHSNRRAPDESAIATIKPIYAQLLEIEKSHANGKEGMAASLAALVKTLEDANTDYDRFIFSLAA